MRTPEIEARYTAYVEALNAQRLTEAAARGYRFTSRYELRENTGRGGKYRRIISVGIDLENPDGPGPAEGSVEAFVDDVGGVYFPDGWKGPKLKGGPRYNVADDASFAQLVAVAGHDYYLYSVRYAKSMGYDYSPTAQS